jgi:phosphatidylserine/phosphatidylglycerophosphate/cardiolipin synthase-like enzyme
MKNKPLARIVATAALAALTTQAQATVEGPGFSPEGSAEALVLKVIDSARQSIRLAAYTITAPKVVHALIAARRRGVDVAVVADYENNITQDRTGKSHAALNLLVGAGIPTRLVSVYPLHHDKYIVVDGASVETGSYNYTVAAARYNSENVLVVWNEPAVARAYLDHWQSRYDQGRDYKAGY